MNKILITDDLETYNKIFNLLGYEENKRRHIPLSKLSLVSYKKVKEVKNYVALKDRYMPRSTLPFSLVVLFIIIAVSLATTYLILNIVNEELDKLFYFYTLMLPTSISTLIATAISFYRYFVELKNIEKMAAIPLLRKEVEKNEHNS